MPPELRLIRTKRQWAQSMLSLTTISTPDFGFDGRPVFIVISIEGNNIQRLRREFGPFGGRNDDIDGILHRTAGQDFVEMPGRNK